MRKNISMIFMALLVGILLVACGSNSDSDKASDGDSEDTTSETDSTGEDTAEAEDTTLTYTHDLGETVIEKNPEKVVVFDMGVLDTLDNLGVEIAGVPKGNIPNYLDKYDGDDYVNAGTLFEPDFEEIYELDPDLIIISGRASEAYDELSDIAPTLFMGIDSNHFVDSFKENVTMLGEIFGKEDEAAKEIAAFDEKLDSLAEKAEADEINGLILMVSEGELSAYGPGSRFGFIHDDFGIKAVDDTIDSDAKHGQNISYEYIVEKDPEYIFVIDRGAAVGGEVVERDEFENDLIQSTSAYKDGNIIYLNPVYAYISAGGTTSLTGLLDEVIEGLE